MERLTRSLEDYLEAVYVLETREGVARISSVSAALGVTKPSANSAVKILKERRYIEHERYGHITLTSAGRERARGILSSHNDVKELLCWVLGVRERSASRQACEIEHVINADTHRRIAAFVGFLKSDAGARGLVESFKEGHHGKRGAPHRA